MKTPLRTVLKKFLDHVEDLEARRKLCDDQYETEFQQLRQLTESLRSDPEYSCTFGYKEENRPKNRYKDIVPYDFCRVILPECPDVFGSDYVNASYIKGCSGAFAYIAAQGPLTNTLIDFWSMIWACDVQVIVMACNELEGGKTKCVPYWPQSGEVKQFGKITVQHVNEAQVCPDFLVRTLNVRQGSESREVWQFHYSTWLDHSVPDTVQPILQLVRLVRDCQASETAPILIHCSAGCGRTGTICAIDFIWVSLRTGKLDESFCLYDIVAAMRKQRIAMVQTKEQYMLIHKAVASMFEQQLKLIDNHVYENLGKDGKPLKWNGQFKEEVFGDVEADIIIGSRKKKSLIEPAIGIEKNKELVPTSSSVLNEAQSLDRKSAICQTGSKNETILESVTSAAVPNSGQSTSSQGNSSSLDLGKELDGSTACEAEPCKSALSGDGSKNEVQASQVKCITSTDLVLISPDSSESIPFIDDDDTKSEIHVRARCGRAYLHIPSCDSISKIVNRFDPFVDKVYSEVDDSCIDSDHISFSSDISSAITSARVSSSEAVSLAAKSVDSTTAAVSGKQKSSENLNNVSTCSGDSELKEKGKLMQKQHFEIVNNGRQQEKHENEQTNVFHSISDIGSSSRERAESKSLNRMSVARRPSIAKLKSLFERSVKARSEDKGAVVRHHSHHVSRAGSAPPSLSCMKKNSSNEKESLFGMVTRKFRSSSVKSEQELRKEVASTSTLTSFKKSAISSFSHIKHNISNFSRNMPFVKQKSPNKQTSGSHAIWHTSDTPKVSSQFNSGQSASRNDDPKAKDCAYDRTSGSDSMSNLKSPSSYKLSDSREILQQKFVVNLLSSSHGQSNSLSRAEKPKSPKTKNFELDCLKMKAFTNSQSKTKEPSTAWYHPLNHTSDNCCGGEEIEGYFKDSREKSSSADVSPLAATEEVIESGIPSFENCSLRNEISGAEVFKQSGKRTVSCSPHSRFYTNISMPSELVSATVNPLKSGESDEYGNSTLGKAILPNSSQAKEVGNSKFFWPSNSSIGAGVATCEITGSCHKYENVHDDVSGPKHAERLSINQSSNSKNDSLKQSETNAGSCTSEEKTSLLLAESSKPESERKQSLEVTRTLPEKVQTCVSQPPALPKKTVIGRHKNFSFEVLDVLSKKPQVKDPEQIEKCDLSEVPKISSFEKEKEIKTPTEICVSESNNNVYINVNAVTKKNIEQIESTLRAHPRGAIIDLTSRQSYSMEEELAAAVQSLPEPVKKKSGIQPGFGKVKGYEVIWPCKNYRDGVSDAESGTGETKFNVAKPDSIQNRKLKQSVTSQREFVHSAKAVGLCYSPPLRRSTVSNFPVLKSRSCASLEWLQSEKIDDFPTCKQEVHQGKCDSRETLVSEAVVELSTLLDELTTKTLTDDLSQNLDISKNKEKPTPNCHCHVKEEQNGETSKNISRSSFQASNNHANSSENHSAQYETTYLPQVSALTLKNSSDAEIVFHFPPPPSMPPPPQNDSVAESFDILCKDGRLHVSSAESCGTTADTGGHGLRPEAKRSSAEQKSHPVPLPRKMKHMQQSPGLRKSASYTTLAPDSFKNVKYENVSVERHQTLPRSQICEMEPIGQAAFSGSYSVTSLDIESNNSFKNSALGSHNHNYETVFPQIQKDVQQVKGSRKSSRDGVRQLTYACAETSCSPSEERIENINSMIGRDLRKIENEITSCGKERKTTESLRKLHSELKVKQQVGTCISNVRTTTCVTETSPGMPLLDCGSVYGKINVQSQRQAAQHRLENSHNQPRKSGELHQSKTKMSPLPSRKAQCAPLPPIDLSSKKTPKALQEIEGKLSGRSQMKLPSRKAGRAPDPPLLQRSASLKVTASARDLDRSETRQPPTYAKVQKQKLHAVFENISDTQCALGLSEVKALPLSRKGGPKHMNVERQFGLGLQHSRSDASVFLALRTQKYQHKVPEKNVQSFHRMSSSDNSGTTSESSSCDSDNSLRKLNFSDEQKLLKGLLREKVHTPVAPPRSKRRNTMEIHCMEDYDTKGASCSDLQSYIFDQAPDTAPNVPAKTKDAFDVPDEFKSKEKSTSGGAKMSNIFVRRGSTRGKGDHREMGHKAPVIYRK